MKRRALYSIRKDYRLFRLLEENMHPDPLKQFSIWMSLALEKEIKDATAMALATVDQAGCPTVRMVLLKGISEKGFVFFTNYDSLKGNDIAHNHHVALAFFWSSLERQIRIEGTAEKISSQESDEYFLSRPLNSQIAAYASPQSKVIPNREYLEEKFSEYEQLLTAEKIKRPDNWGGYRVIPNRIEFWQGRPARLHDRIRYTQINEEWMMERLAP